MPGRGLRTSREIPRGREGYRRQRTWVWALPLVALAGAGCSDDDPVGPVGLGEFPVGTYTVTLEESDAPGIAGEWRMVWTEGGEFEVSFEGDPFVSGMFAVEGEELTLEDRAGIAPCPDPGRHAWSWDPPELTLVAVADSCAGRVNVLTSRAWTAQ